MQLAFSTNHDVSVMRNVLRLEEGNRRTTRRCSFQKPEFGVTPSPYIRHLAGT
ncbi:hypothetical protein K443DRAFT_682844 [Laccaria amethystina LaAM-08-1]|uniref:Uncharacterized protein n=1 Tax=Laccaria amethystina LaAM-08-1 TaxID=1095629 RepID=A0A0C9WK23_9AGAR|nr:hypothetical protein K443DRAFT_682844 [Laccaria amethystina LaAM-08-1]